MTWLRRNILLLVALAVRELGEADYLRYIDQIGLKPQVLELEGQA